MSAKTADTMLERIAQLEEDLGICSGRVVNLQITNIQLKKELLKLRLNNDDLQDSVYDLEKQNHKNNQYSRRENIELANIPESITQKKLELKMVEIINEMGIVISSYHIVAVHRIGKKLNNKPRNVIIRFINRKNVYRILSNSRKLSAAAKKCGCENVYAYENLCPGYRNIFNQCYKLKKENVLKDVWTKNGCVNITFPDDEYEIAIAHFEEIEFYLNNNWPSLSEKFDSTSSESGDD